MSTYNLELINGCIDMEISIKGENQCLHTPALFIPNAHHRLAWTVQSSCLLRAMRYLEEPTIQGGKTANSIQGRVMKSNGSRNVEQNSSCELLALSRINGTGLATQLKFAKLHGIVISDERTVLGIVMTPITPFEIWSHLRTLAFKKGPSCTKGERINALQSYTIYMPTVSFGETVIQWKPPTIRQRMLGRLMGWSTRNSWILIDVRL